MNMLTSECMIHWDNRLQHLSMLTWRTYFINKKFCRRSTPNHDNFHSWRQSLIPKTQPWFDRNNFAAPNVVATTLQLPTTLQQGVGIEAEVADNSHVVDIGCTSPRLLKLIKRLRSHIPPKLCQVLDTVIQASLHALCAHLATLRWYLVVTLTSWRHLSLGQHLLSLSSVHLI